MESQDFDNQYMKSLSYDEQLSHLNSWLPDEPYIAVFGTSHSAGSCEHTRDGEQQFWLPEQEIWCNIVAQELGMPVVNFSVTGNFNLYILEQINQFLELDKRKNCVQVFAELRIAENTVNISHDSVMPWIIDNEQTVSKCINNIKIASLFITKWGRQCIEKHTTVDLWKTFTLEEQLTKQVAYLKGNSAAERKSMAKQFTSFSDCLEDNNDLVNAWNSFMTGFMKFQGQTFASHVRDLRMAYTMSTLFRISGIPFKWFCWDTKFKTNQYISENDIELFQEKCRQLLPGYNKDELTCFAQDGAQPAYLFDTAELPEQCDCGHQRESFHKWVANKILEEIKE